MNIRIKRVYEAPALDDGYRILVDRLWPRGINKQKARIDLWMKEIAPSTELRKWYNHDPEKWNEFCDKYAAELKTRGELLDQLMSIIKEQTVTFLYSSKETKLNNAYALKRFLENFV